MTQNTQITSENIQIPRASLLRYATYASVFTAFALIVAKIAAFVFTGSMAILATVVDSCLDLLASFINMLAVRQATWQDLAKLLSYSAPDFSSCLTP